jgi:N-acetylated-alpha-linked acidic dipeptidase
MNHRLIAAAVSISLAAILVQAQSSTDRPLLGFTAANAAKEYALESQFDSKLNRDDLRAWMKRLSARPHHLGSPYDRQNAEFIASLFRSWGYDTAIEEFQVLFPSPKTRLLEMVEPQHLTARISEPALKEDATSDQSSEQLPVFNAYSVDGDVTGQLVYVNYGVPKDYEELERRGVDVAGKIAIARYGGSWRGIKPKVAAEHGAIGCLIYSDPRDDGYAQGDVYPAGAYRNEWGAQRGSVMDMPTYPGDPLTPGIGATASAKRLDRSEVQTFTKIPVIPISYGDALPLLRALGGPVAPPDWRGALPITYHLGPGPAKVHLKLEFNWNMVPALDVIARLRGSERPDEWIVRGNHHDAWVNGAEDPISGQVAMLEEAKAIGELVKTGWRPKRTIIFAAWDGEEEGLIGSTEWAETHAAELKKNAVAYINSDTNSRGFLEMSGSHSLEAFANQVGRDVIDPETKVSVLQRRRADEVAKANVEQRKAERERREIRISALGSGSDYSSFLQHLGVASMNIGYGGEGEGGSYHSIYDSFDHFTRFIDPGFVYGVTLSQTGGRIVLRLANADVLPFAYSPMSDTVSRYADEVSKLAETSREEIEERNAEVADRTWELSADPTIRTQAPKLETVPPFLNFAPLRNSVARLQRAAATFDEARISALSAPNAVVVQPALDEAMMHMEQALTRSEGLPGRPWYTHYIYAPGKYTGYGVKTLPAVREAIEQKQWDEANRQIVILGQVLDGYAAALDRAASLAKGKAE